MILNPDILRSRIQITWENIPIPELCVQGGGIDDPEVESYISRKNFHQFFETLKDDDYCKTISFLHSLTVEGIMYYLASYLLYTIELGKEDQSSYMILDDVVSQFISFVNSKKWSKIKKTVMVEQCECIDSVIHYLIENAEEFFISEEDFSRLIETVSN